MCILHNFTNGVVTHSIMHDSFSWLGDYLFIFLCRFFFIVVFVLFILSFSYKHCYTYTSMYYIATWRVFNVLTALLLMSSKWKTKKKQKFRRCLNNSILIQQHIYTQTHGYKQQQILYNNMSESHECKSLAFCLQVYYYFTFFFLLFLIKFKLTKTTTKNGLN